MKKENNELVKDFLNSTFFKSWKNQYWKKNEKYCNYRALEVQLNALCDLNCKYCYYAKYKKELYPAKISSPKLVMKNLNMLLKWLEKNEYYPEIEIFSGEPFSQEIGFQALNKLVKWYSKNKISANISVPTNYSFIFDDVKIKRMESLLRKAEKNNIHINLSCSVDGKYCDSNRPFKDGKIRDDEYYNKMFEFVSKWGFAFHPMVYSEKIERWKDNFLWFQKNMEKYNINWTKIYLLDVRNKEWNTNQLKEYYKFIRFLLKWSYEKLELEGDEFIKFIFDNRLFNSVSNVFSTVGRGLGCSMQSTIQLRLGDLTTSVCHRLAYKPFNLWKFIVDKNEIVDIESLNHNMLFSMASLNFKNLPYCEYCAIRELCVGQCVGSMYETNGDPFIPIPTVCAVQHLKVKGLLDEMYDLNLLQHLYPYVNLDKQDNIRLYFKYFKENYNES